MEGGRTNPRILDLGTSWKVSDIQAPAALHPTKEPLASIG
jgi:hypothetical protein